MCLTVGPGTVATAIATVATGATGSSFGWLPCSCWSMYSMIWLTSSVLASIRCCMLSGRSFLLRFLLNGMFIIIDANIRERAPSVRGGDANAEIVLGRGRQHHVAECNRSEERQKTAYAPPAPRIETGDSSTKAQHVEGNALGGAARGVQKDQGNSIRATLLRSDDVRTSLP